MTGSLQTYFNFYQFPPGRRLFALREVTRRAEEMRQPTIAELARAAVRHDEQTVVLEAGWRRSRSRAEGKRAEANAVDAQLDRVLGSITTQLGSFVHAFGEADLGARAAALQTRLFPEGASAITTMSYENELAAADVVLRDLTGPHADDAAALGLTPFVDRLKALIAEFRAALGVETQREVTYDQVREANAAGQEAMLRVIAKILGEFGGPGDDHVQTRQALLAPILSQNRRIAEGYSSRRPAGDIDPATGSELSEPEPAEAATG